MPNVDASSLARRRFAGALALARIGCSPAPLPPPSPGEVSATVRQAHADAVKGVDLADPASFADAKRGFIAAPMGQVKDAAGQVIWDFDAFAVVQGAVPATVNPGLWRQALLNNQVGLFTRWPAASGSCAASTSPT